MTKFGFALLLLLNSTAAYTQRERIHLDVNQYSFKAGDTVWFEAYILRGLGPSTLSTNLYVEIFTRQGILVQRTCWPIFHGQSTGQLVLNDSLPTDNYYIVARTKQQLNYDTVRFFSVPVLVYNKEKPKVLHHLKEISKPAGIAAVQIAGIYWATILKDGQLSTMLELDSGSARRKFRLVKPKGLDSVWAADITLDSTHPTRYADYPVDSTLARENLFLYEDTTAIGRQSFPLQNTQLKVMVHPDTFDVSPNGYNSWDLHVSDSTRYHLSVSVTDADRSISSPAPITELAEAYADDLTIPNRLVDTSFIRLSGNATKENHLFGGKTIKDPFSRHILLAGVRDSIFLFIKTTDIDEKGGFALDSLFFYGSIDLQYQINKEEDGSTKNIHVTLARFVPPAIDSSSFDNWVDQDKLLGKEDTLFSPAELSAHELAGVKTLKAAVVTHSESHRKELDNVYTTGAFSEPSMYSFDVRTETRVHDIGAYLRMQLGMQGGFSDSDLPFLNGHPIVWFVDQEAYTWPELSIVDWDRIAYIKVLRSDFLVDDPFVKWKTGQGGFQLVGGGKDQLAVPVSETPYEICIYLRKGKDFRTMPGGLNKIAVKGFDAPLVFKPDYVTLLWDPRATGPDYRIRFTNKAGVRSFRVKVEGISDAGKLIHFETVVE
jgi:hypothetical protein